MEKRVAVYAGSRELYPFMTGSIKSLIKNGGVDKIYILIEDDQYPYPLPDMIETINMSGQNFFTPDGPNYHDKFTYLALCRVCLTKILPPEIETVLSIDCDTVVLKNIDDIWAQDLTGYYMAMTMEPYKCRWEEKYFNAGVNLQNLKLIREDGKDDEMIRLLNTTKFDCVDQDAFNIACKGKIMEMPGEYNHNRWTVKPFREVCIEHFAGCGVRNWGCHELMQRYIQMSWKEVLKGRR